jgi:GTP-binding protein
VFAISGATGEGIDSLLDAILGYLPAITASEQPGEEVEQDEPEKPWSPL